MTASASEGMHGARDDDLAATGGEQRHSGGDLGGVRDAVVFGAHAQRPQRGAGEVGAVGRIGRLQDEARGGLASGAEFVGEVLGSHRPAQGMPGEHNLLAGAVAFDEGGRAARVGDG